MRPSNIASAFKKCRLEHRPALLTYTVSGDPNKKKSFEILKAISSYADICEIGVGHNCNTGDGKQIQDSTYRAIKNGIKIKDTFAIVKRFKKTKNSNPCILMGYYNSVVQYGENRFIKKCKQVGVDGLIVVDLPWPENKNFSKKCKNLFYSFGHHHLGWTLGAISGKIIAGMIAKENTNLDLSPYNSQRFS